MLVIQIDVRQRPRGYNANAEPFWEADAIGIGVQDHTRPAGEWINYRCASASLEKAVKDAAACVASYIEHHASKGAAA